MARVLLVDDESMIRDMLRRMLEARGHQVLEAGDGPAALELYEAERPDMVLLDLVMPGMNGLETLVELRKLDPEARIAMLTSMRQEDTVRRAIQLGARDYVVKPVMSGRLMDAVNRLTAGAT